MKKILLLLITLVSITSVDAQKQIAQNELFNDNAPNVTKRKIFYDGVVYMQLKPEYRKSATRAKDVKMLQEAPFLIKYQSAYGLTKLEKPFFKTKNNSLAYTYRLYFKGDIESLIANLSQQAEIEYVEKVPISFIPENFNYDLPEIKNINNKKSSNASANDPYYGNSLEINLNSGTLTFGTKWFLDQINAPDAWGLFTPQAGNPVKVAVVDGAVYKDHEDLNITQSYDAETETNNSNPPTTGDAYEWSHGTHCAGLISAVTNNSIGIPSVGQNLEVIGIKTGRNSDGALLYFYEGLIYAMEQTDAKVISLSVGSYGYSITEQSIINQAYEQDIVVLAAASNDDINMKSYPAAYEHVIAVGSVSANDEKSNFSNFGDWVDVMSPGGNLTGSYYLLLSTTFAESSNDGMGIAATYPVNGNPVNGKYHMMAGTSMATPVAAGLVGLMRAADPTLNSDQIEAILKRTCTNIDKVNSDYIGSLGAGRINAFKAIETIQQSNSLIAVIAYSKLNIGPGATVNFSDKSLGSPTSWEWTFEGPETITSDLQNPNIIFNTVGDYTARLVVFNATTSDTAFLSQQIQVGTSTSIEIQATAFSEVSRGITYISVVDKNIVWALAYDGSGEQEDIQEFTKTINGGETWTAKNFGLSTDLSPSMIHAISETVAWAAFYETGTSAGGIFKTTDGGNNWIRQSTASFSGAASFANVVYFWNENDGVCMGDPEGGYFELYTTANGGTSWTRVDNTNGVLNETAAGEYGTVGYFTVGDDESFFFNTNKGRIFKTTDKGQTWSVYQTPISGSNKIAFSDENYGLAVDAENENAYFTSNGGTTWAELDYSGEFFTSHFIYVPGSKNMFASAGADYEADKLGLTLSTDGGKTWKDIPELTDQQCLAIGFSDITTGWIGQFSQTRTTGGMLKYSGPNTFVAFDMDNDYTCFDQSTSITFTDKTSTGETNPSYFWDFGSDATPTTANTKGPHTVTYSAIGTRTVYLTVNDVYKTDNIIKINEPAIYGSITVDTTRVCMGASAEFSLVGTSGSVIWEKSLLQNNSFSPSENSSAESYNFISNPVEDTTYYRAKVYSLGCNEIYSDIIKIDVSRVKAEFSWARDAYIVDFTDLSENAIDYNWDFGDGGTSDEANPSHEYPSDDNYEAKQVVINNDGCLDSTIQTVVVNVTGIENSIQNAELKVFPNPSNGQFYIEINGLKNLETKIVISEINGRIVFEKQNYTNKFYIDIANYNTGIYFLRIYTEQGIATKKIVIQ